MQYCVCSVSSGSYNAMSTVALLYLIIWIADCIVCKQYIYIMLIYKHCFIQSTRAVLRLVWPLISSLVMSMMTLKCSFPLIILNTILSTAIVNFILSGIIYNVSLHPTYANASHHSLTKDPFLSGSLGHHQHFRHYYNAPLIILNTTLSRATVNFKR